MPGTVHLHPTAELAARVLLPGDPGRALLLAQSLLEKPQMFNHNRGLWGYSGTARDGHPLSIQSTGMGGPSAAIVASELIELGAERLLRVGTCGALDPSLELGELLIATEAISADGTSQALGAGARARSGQELEGALHAAGGARHGAVVSTDLFYEDRAGLEDEWRGQGALAVEMETAALFTLAARRGVAAGSLLIVSDQLTRARARINTDALRAAEQAAGALALRALA